MVKFSVIVPVYNVNAFIEQCLQSILQDEFEDYELILINDGSTDSSGIICDFYAKKYNHIKVIHQENKGLPAARNRGLDVAIGEYICFVDSDDFVNKDYFKKILEGLTEKPDMLSFNYQEFNSNSSVSVVNKKKIVNRTDTEKLLINTTNTNELWFVWRRVFKKSFLEKNQIRFDEKVTLGEDTIFMYTVFSVLEEVAYIDSELYNYRDNDKSLTQTKYKENLLSKFEYHYKARKSIACINLPDNKINNDIANYYINHTLFWFFTNLKNSPHHKLNEIKAIRDSIIYRETFKNYKYNWKNYTKSLLIKLFQYKQYHLLFKLLKIK